MSVIAPWLIVALVLAFVSYHRYSLAIFAAMAVSGLVASALFGASMASVYVLAGLLALIVLPLLITPIRQRFITAPLLGFYSKILPPLSDTEKVALEAGTVGFEGELFSGKPDWQQLLSQPKPVLSAEEQAFIDGPVEQVCLMCNDWETTHVHADLSPEIWEYLKVHKFFGMIIPKEYGGLGFSAFAHSRVIVKLASVSATLSSTVGVPNSLGPGELLLHYGTPEQKDHYLPRLANGLEIPCFGLTGPTAGSDATSIPDYGIVCKGEWEGASVLGVRMNFEKRYITLAPVATIIGLAFRLYDPDGLLSDQNDRGITLALIPRGTKGMSIGRRHLPLNCVFQNGPIFGKDVFIPLSQLIGGEDYVGHGWRMLVECLSIGRSITLPSMSSGGAKMAAVVTGAYSRIRKQFGLSIGRFEGVEEALARIAGNAYASSALSQSTAAAVDRGEKPAVPSAIAKYHCTEMARECAKDAMDIHGGKGVILGPKNYLGRAWQAAPIAITVEGANIMTRSLMIFGQGAIRCHPWVLKEMQAAQLADPVQRLKEFDVNLFGHIGFAFSNAIRSLSLGITNSRFGAAPGTGISKRCYRKLNRYSANLALVADTSMLLLGGKLKFKESLSGRLGDVLSQLYIASAMLKRHEDEGRPASDEALMAYAFNDCVFKIERALSGALRNFPNRPAAWLLWLLVFPFGRRAQEPSDRLAHRAAAMLMSPSDARDRLADGLFLTPCANNPAGRVNAALIKVILAEPVERKFLKALKNADIEALSFPEQLAEGLREGWISLDESKQLEELRELTWDAITVDDFDHAELIAATAVKNKAFEQAA